MAWNGLLKNGAEDLTVAEGTALLTGTCGTPAVPCVIVRNIQARMTVTYAQGTGVKKA